jgi:uncharacterized glyoxalase superfamily protein PhnB
MSSRPRSTSSNIYPCLYYRDAPAAIEWLCRTFGFENRLIVPGEGGTIAHAELTLGDGVIMVATCKPERGWVSPRDLLVVNQAISVFVPDPDAHYAHAKSGGVEITYELKDEEYGARGYMAKDIEGNHWHFGNYRPGPHWSS